MTSWTEVEHDERYKKVLDHGFVGLVDIMGNDDAVADAARISYAKGTKKVNNNRGLIRYLVKHKHTSPLEMAELKFHIKIPVFVMRQLERHRTASQNQQSYRYSTITDEFYIPELSQIATQSATNNQGRGSVLDLENAKEVQRLMREANDASFEAYSTLLGPVEGEEFEFGNFDSEYTGIARELARTVIPVSVYTEVVWKQNLHNLFHLLKLRLDSHAQYEIRVFAQAIYDLIKPYFPVCVEAFEDYNVNALSVSSMERQLLSEVFDLSNLTGTSVKEAFNTIVGRHTDLKTFGENYRLSLREVNEFKNNWNL